MLLLTSTSDKIQVITGSALGTDVHASFVDYSGSVLTPGRTNTAISTATTTDVVASPGSNIQRALKMLTIRNTDASASNAITVQHTDGTTVATLCLQTLAPGDALHFDEIQGFWVINLIDSTVLALTYKSWRLIDVNVLSTPGAGTFITSVRTSNIRVRLVGGGGGGGGTATATSSGGAAGGGSAGSYAEKLFNVTPSTAYSFQVGAAGLGGTAGTNNGGVGGSSTFTVGATTVSTNGGLGGIGSAAVTAGVNLGGASSTVSVNGDVNSAGAPGGYGVIASAAGILSGFGGSSIWGDGGRPQTGGSAGNAGTGFGSGGSGAGCASNSGTKAGGAGAPGLVVVEEYT